MRISISALRQLIIESTWHTDTGWSRPEEMGLIEVPDGPDSSSGTWLLIIDPKRLHNLITGDAPELNLKSIIAGGILLTSAAQFGPCLEALQINASFVTNHTSIDAGSGSNFPGNLLYELAIAWADEHGHPIMADRGSVSPSAARRWEKMAHGPWRGRSMDLDGYENFDYPRTPDLADDCSIKDHISQHGNADWHAKVWRGGDAGLLASMRANGNKIRHEMDNASDVFELESEFAYAAWQMFAQSYRSRI